MKSVVKLEVLKQLQTASGDILLAVEPAVTPRINTMWERLKSKLKVYGKSTFIFLAIYIGKEAFKEVPLKCFRKF